MVSTGQLDLERMALKSGTFVFFYENGCFACILCVLGPQEDRRRLWIPLEEELETAVNHDVDAGTEHLEEQPLSHPSSP